MEVIEQPDFSLNTNMSDTFTLGITRVTTDICEGIISIPYNHADLPKKLNSTNGFYKRALFALLIEMTRLSEDHRAILVITTKNK